MGSLKEHPLKKHLNHSGASDEEVEKLCKRLTDWCIQFTDDFIDKKDVYEQEIGGKIEKLNKRTGLLDVGVQTVGAAAGGAATFFSGFGAVGAAPGRTLGQKASGLLKYVDSHKSKARNVTYILQKISNSTEIETQSCRVAVGIFTKYEYQFMKLFLDKEWPENNQVLITDAIKRIVNYIDTHCDDIDKELSNGDEENMFDLIVTKSFLFGKHAILLKRKFDNVKSKIKQTWSFSEINRNCGYVRKNHQGELCYQQCGNKLPSHGYRLLFDWEIQAKTSDKDTQEQTQLEEKYKYLINSEKTNEMVAIILEIRHQKESKKKGLHKIETQLENLKDTLLTMEIKKGKLPFLFRLIPPIASFTGRAEKLVEMHNILQMKGTGRIPHAVYIVGMGGTGKSELARKFAEEYAEKYGNNLIWIVADTQENLEQFFRALAVQCNISMTKNISGKEVALSTNEIVDKVYYHFREETSLFIFDNAGSFESVSKFLPRSSVLCKPFFIITSRNINCEEQRGKKSRSIKLDKFEESFEFMKSVLKSENEDEHIQELVELLHYLPLALQQAASYIINKNEDAELEGGDKYRVKDYIEDFGKNKPDLLNKHFDENCEDEKRYFETVYTTWNVTLDNISRNRSCGSAAIEIIRIMSYMAPDRINLKEWFIDQSTDAWNPLKLLQQYCMINIYMGIGSIHRLVQEVIRIQLAAKNLHKIILMKGLDLTKEERKKERGVKMHDGYYANRHDCNKHLISLWNYASEYPDLMEEFCKECRGEDVPLEQLCLMCCQKALATILNCWQESKLDLYKKLIEEPEMHKSMLRFAVLSDNKNVVKLFVDKGIKTDMLEYQTQNSILHIACERGSLDVVILLVEEAKVPRDVLNSNKNIPAYVAATSGHVDIVEYLTEDFDGVERIKYKLCAMIHAVDSEETLASLRNYLNFIESQKLPEDVLNLKLGPSYPLHMAIRVNYPGLISLLIDFGANLSPTKDQERNYLKLACLYGYTNSLKEMIVKDADINLVNESGFSFVHDACMDGHVDVIHVLIEAGINLKTKDELGTNLLFHVPYYVLTELEIIKFFSERLFDMHQKDILGRTALHSAVRGHQLEFIEYFIENGVDPREKDYFGYTLLHYATTICDLDMLNFHNYDDLDLSLFPNGEKPSKTILSRYCYTLHPNYTIHMQAVIKYLIDKGVSPSERDRNNRTPIYYVAYHGLRADCVKLLIDATDKCVVREVDSDGRNILHFGLMHENYNLATMIAQNGFVLDKIEEISKLFFRTNAFYKIFYFETIQSLVSAGADILKKDVYDCTPLHYACLFCTDMVMQYIISKEENIEAEDKNGCTPLHYAAFGANFNVLQEAVAKNINLSVTNNLNQTLLHVAVLSIGHEREKEHVLEILLKANVDMNLKDIDGKTALDYARHKNDAAIIKLLETWVPSTM